MGFHFHRAASPQALLYKPDQFEKEIVDLEQQWAEMLKAAAKARGAILPRPSRSNSKGNGCICQN